MSRLQLVAIAVTVLASTLVHAETRPLKVTLDLPRYDERAIGKDQATLLDGQKLTLHVGTKAPRSTYEITPHAQADGSVTVAIEVTTFDTNLTDPALLMRKFKVDVSLTSLEQSTLTLTSVDANKPMKLKLRADPATDAEIAKWGIKSGT